MSNPETRQPAGRLGRLAGKPVIALGVPLIIAAIAVAVLHRLASHVSWGDVSADLGAASWLSLARASGFTALSFAGIALYDVFAARAAAPGRMPWHIPATAGAAGYAVSGLLGLSYVTGAAIRYRVYAAFGLGAGTIADLFAVSWSGFFSGLAVILGVLLALRSADLGAALPLSPLAGALAGVVLLAAFGAYLAWLAGGRRRVTLGRFAFSLPSAPVGLGLTGAGILDLAGAAMTLHVLLPADVAPDLPYYFAVYYVAVCLGILSHSPGGLGVFEAVIVAGLDASGRADVLAALVLYRAIYTVLPFAVAAAGLGSVAGLAHRSRLGGTAHTLWQAAKPLVPVVAAGVAMLAGVILVVSGNLPPEGSRLGLLRKILPLYFVEASHLANSVAGVLLIVLARGLYRRLHRAWVLAMLMLAVGLVASLPKGLDWKEALSMLAALGVLGLLRPAFYRAEATSALQLNRAWLLRVTALLAALFWIGVFAHSHVPYRNDLWWQFTWHGDASRFLRASLAGAIVLAAVALNALLSGKPRRRHPEPIPEAVRRLVADSENAEARLALTGDKAFLIDENERAFIAYADTGRSLIAKGDPVGDVLAGTDLIWRLREMAYQQGKRCAFYAVSTPYLPTYLDLGLSAFKIGEVARVPLEGFTLEGPEKKRVRQARNRAARDGFTFRVIPPGDLAPLLAELRAVSDAWLDHKQGQEKGFALGAFDDDYIASCDMAVLCDPSGRIAAFANLLRGARQQELALDLMRHRPDGPGFAMDALMAEMMLWGAAQGYRWFSLGAAPFSGIENRQLAPIWNRIGGFVYEHGDHFYNFEGLRAFKQKFDPVWSPNYLVCPGGLAAPQILYEVNMLISGGLRGLLK